MSLMITIGKRARAAARQFAGVGASKKNNALEMIAAQLENAGQEILEANQVDLQAGKAAGLTPALLDRLALNEVRLAGVVADLRNVINLPDPVGEVFDQTELPNGLRMHKQRVPLGVLGIIYEARPNVTVDVAGLALKTGNAAILRGGSETIHSNRALVQAIRAGLQDSGLPSDAIQFVDDADRARVHELLQMHQYVDLLIPRGGAALHAYCRENSRIPVITGGIGICHLFVDESAKLGAAIEVIHNAKVQRPSVCNALDTVLVHKNVAAQLVPALVQRLAASGVSFRVDEAALELLRDSQGKPLPEVAPAGESDFDTEWLSLVLGIKTVENMQEAIEHISEHSTGHSDGILTGDPEHAQRFVASVDSAVVYINASTRFTDGAQLGLGAEVAISTQRLHARGPMGLRELTTYKWVVQGDYQVRA